MWLYIVNLSMKDIAKMLDRLLLGIISNYYHLTVF